MKGILKYEDVVKISDFMKENGYENMLTVVNEIENQETMNLINDDYFYRFRTDDMTEPTYNDNISVECNGTKFLYVLKYD